MIRRYGLRPLTLAEQPLFPGLRLVLHIDKVRLIKPPPVPKARAGWIVWLAETRPGAYLVRLPGGAALPVPYNQMVWEKVPVETAITTLKNVRADEQRQRAEAQKWRPGQTITTPGTRLSFNSLTRWMAGWQQLQGRANSSARYEKEEQHLQALPPEMIAAETDEMVLYDFLSLLKVDDVLPPKGFRADHPTTLLATAAHACLAKLGAMPHRHYRRQKALHATLTVPVAGQSGKRPLTQKGASHLSLF